MTTLARLQTEIRTALHRLNDEQPGDPSDCQAAATFAPIYPALRRLAGEPGFAWLAAETARRGALAGRMCRDPAALLQDMMRTDRRLRVLAYAVDLAALEWAMQTAWIAPKALRLDAAQLALVPTEDLPALEFRRQAGWSLVASPYPVLEIWQACQGEDDKHVALGFGGEPTRLLIGRAWSEVVWLHLTCRQLQLLRQLEAGRPLGAAIGAIRPEETGGLFDFLAGLVDRGVFMEIEPNDQPTAFPALTLRAGRSRQVAMHTAASAPLPA